MRLKEMTFFRDLLQAFVNMSSHSTVKCHLKRMNLADLFYWFSQILFALYSLSLYAGLHYDIHHDALKSSV